VAYSHERMPRKEVEMSRAEDVTRDHRATDCAWCRAEFSNIVDLLLHVEDEHLAGELRPAA